VSAILTSCVRNFYVKRTGEDAYAVSPEVVWGDSRDQPITAKEATFGEPVYANLLKLTCAAHSLSIMPAVV